MYLQIGKRPANKKHEKIELRGNDCTSAVGALTGLDARSRETAYTLGNHCRLTVKNHLRNSSQTSRMAGGPPVTSHVVCVTKQQSVCKNRAVTVDLDPYSVPSVSRIELPPGGVFLIVVPCLMMMLIVASRNVGRPAVYGTSVESHSTPVSKTRVLRPAHSTGISR